MEFPGIHQCGSGPIIITLHSSLSSSKQWALLTKQLSEQFTFINIDILGYGQAPKVSDAQGYNFDVEVKRINNALQQLIGEQPYHLIGHSCGGALALKMAVEHPERVLSMALYEPVAFHLLAKESEEYQECLQFYHQVADADNISAAIAFTDYWNGPGFYRQLPDKMQQLMARDMDKVRLDFVGLTTENYQLADLVTLQFPCLLMSGKYSPQLSRSLAEQIVAAIEHCQHQTFRAGHMGPISHSEAVLPLIARFITSIGQNQR